MLKRKIFIGLIFVFGLFFALDASAQDVSGSIGNGTVKRGGSTRGTIVLDIPGGLHVNSNRPNNEYQIPTRVRVTGAGLRLGAVSYPRGKTKKFQFSETPISVYEGRAVFNFNVNVPANYKGNTIRVRAVVNYQACNDEVCFQPRQKEVTLTARVN
jgi:DsbC/DsbD-like thiol-disulfide interchange protein